MLLLAVVAVYALTFAWSDDLWWYLASGRLILERGALPAHDPFLYTAQSPWFAHSWLWTVALAALERAGGLPAVVAFGAALAVAVFALIATPARCDRYGVLVFAIGLGCFWVAGGRLLLKSSLVSYVLLALYLRMLDRRGGFTWLTGVALTLLQWLWINSHGGWILGVLVVAAYALGRRLRGDTARPGPPLWFPAMLLGLLLVSPSWGSHAPAAFAQLAENASHTGMPIREWLPVWAAASPVTRLKFVFLVALSGFALAAGRRVLPERVLVLAAFVTLSAWAVRFLADFALVAGCYAIAGLGEPAPWLQRLAERFRAAPLVERSAAVLAMLLTCGLCVGFWRARVELAGEPSPYFFAVNPRSACPAAADFVLREEPPAPIFNDAYLGGYLIYRLWPRYQLFTDNRNLDPEMCRSYPLLIADPAQWLRADLHYRFGTVVLGNLPASAVDVLAPLRRFLLQDAGWQLVFSDLHAMVFTRAAQHVSHAELDDGLGGECVPFMSGEWPLGCRALTEPFLPDRGRLLHVQYLSTLGVTGQYQALVDAASESLALWPGDENIHRMHFAASRRIGPKRTLGSR